MSHPKSYPAHVSPIQRTVTRFFALICLACLLNAPAAWGAVINFTWDVGLPGVNSSLGTIDLLAFSRDGVRTNAFANAPVVPGFIPPPIPGASPFAPVVGRINIPKPPLNNFVTVQSQTGGAFAQVTARRLRLDLIRFTAITQVQPGGSRDAAVQAIDPFDVPPQMILYEPTIPSLTLENQLSRERAALTLFAQDSRFVDPLWMLRVFADTPIIQPADLSGLLVEFDSHPVLGLDDSAVANDFRSALTVNAGVITLQPDYRIFSTTYDVSAPIQFSEGFRSIAQHVSEPSGLLLFGAGLAGLGVTMRRSQRKSLDRPASRPRR